MLAAAFRAALPAEATGLAAADDAALEPVLAALVAAAGDPDPAEFVAHLARTSGPASNLEELARRRAADIALAVACAGGEAKAIAAFEAACFEEIARAGARTRAPAALVADVTQRLRRILFVSEDGRAAATTGYTGRGDLRGWVKVIATRELIHALAKEKRERPIGDQDLFDALDAASDPELGYIKEMYREAATAALRGALDALEPGDRDLLRYVVIDGLTVDQLGVLLGVHRATAARRVGKVRDGIRERTRAALAARLGIASDEIDSVMRLVVSRVDMSLERILG